MEYFDVQMREPKTVVDLLMTVWGCTCNMPGNSLFRVTFVGLLIQAPTLASPLGLIPCPEKPPSLAESTVKRNWIVNS